MDPEPSQEDAGSEWTPGEELLLTPLNGPWHRDGVNWGYDGNGKPTLIPDCCPPPSPPN